jgi:two-component system, OmpR family, response regulator VanR
MSAKSKHILLVDDDPEIIKLVKIYLKDTEFKITDVQNGISALAAIKKESFDLLIVDRLMPRMDGITLVNKLKDDLNYDGLIIMMSAHDHEDKKLLEIFDHIYDIIPKPFTANRLKLTIRNAFNYKKIQQKYLTIINSVINDD